MPRRMHIEERSSMIEARVSAVLAEARVRSAIATLEGTQGVGHSDNPNLRMGLECEATC